MVVYRAAIGKENFVRVSFFFIKANAEDNKGKTYMTSIRLMARMNSHVD